MTESRNTSSMLGRFSAGVKAVALIAILGTIALAALASHRGEIDGVASSTMVTASAPAKARSAPSAVVDYLRQAADAAAELPPEH
jgi:hypothetical protein